MDRRGIKRTKAVHINPVPLFIIAIILYLANTLLADHGEATVFSYLAAFAVIFLTGFITYFAQSRHAENSTPVYFAIFLFLGGIYQEMVVFDKGMISALCLSIAFAALTSFICKDNRNEYIVTAISFCVAAGIITPSFIWLAPIVWFFFLSEAESKGKAVLLFLESIVLSATIGFGILFLLYGLDGAFAYSQEWASKTTAITIPGMESLPFYSGLFESWQSTAFAKSILHCLLIIIAIYIVCTYIYLHDKIKTDDAQIAKVTIWISLICLMLRHLFPADRIAFWLLVVTMISVPTSHLLANEGKHHMMNLYIRILFILDLMSIIPVFELIAPYLR